MCGVLGAFGPSAKEMSGNVEAALQAIASRGPDASGVWLSPDGNCLLGHRRLAIVDLSARANQPMKRGEGTLVFNGEIYNHQELRRELTEVSFDTHSDTETLCRGLEHHGARIFDRARGMFAGAFHRENELLLFRDGLGIKPLYYSALDDSTVIFASEIKALLKLRPTLFREVDRKTLDLYLRFENWPQGQSLFKGINLLRPGELMQCTWSSAAVSRRSVKFEYRDSASQGADVETLLGDSVREHLMADVPIGVYLSGGLDSSLVASFASRSVSDVMAFTGYFATGDSHYDERPLSREVAARIGAPLHEVLITPRDFETVLDPLVYALDEPRMGMGSLSQYVVAREAAKHRKVILSGHGGDELFAGYPLFKACWLLQNSDSPQKIFSVIKNLRPKEWPWVLNFVGTFLRRRMLGFAPELFSAAAKDHSGNDEDFLQSCGQDPLSQLWDYYAATYLPGLLVVEDKVSMAHSLETRVPFWSQRLVAWSKNVSIVDKLAGGQSKSQLRPLAQKLLPPALSTAPKRGFPTPFRLWFRRELRDLVRDRLLSRDNPVHEIYPRGKIESLVTSHEKIPLPFALDERRAHRIWMLLCLESWLRQFSLEVAA